MHKLQLRYALSFFLLLLSLSLQAGKKTRILFLLDASSSMTYPWNSGYSRYEVATNILLHIVDSVYAVNNEVEFAVRAYGTLHPAQDKNCTDTRLEVPFNFQNVNQIKTRLQFLKPIGFSPIAYSLEQASKNELSQPAEYDYSIIFITDGGESCNGDICATFSKFLQNKISIQPYVIGLDRNEKLKSYYDCMGKYIEVAEVEDIPKAVALIVDANRKILEKPKVMNLVTTTSKVETIIDTVKKVLPLPPLKKDEMFVLDFSVFPFKVNKITFETDARKMFLLNKVATLRFSLEETPKPIKIDKIELEKLFASSYHRALKDKVNISAKTKSFKKKRATLRFEIDEPLERSPITCSTMTFEAFELKTTTLKPLKGKLLAVKNKKATVRIDYEEPIVRVNDVYPFMKVGSYFNSKKKEVAITPKKFKNTTKSKAVVRIDYEVPVIRNLSEFKLLEPHYWTKAKKTETISLLAKSKKINSSEKAVLRFDYEVPKKENMVVLKARDYPKRTGYAMALPSRTYAMKKDKAVMRFDFEAPSKPVVKKDTATKIKNNATDPMQFEVTTEASAETQIQIFLVGEDGKEYPKAQPTIQILNPVTKDTMYRFIRTMEGGKPKIEAIKPGKYDVIIKEYNVASSFDVTIEPNKINKVTLRLRKGTLNFAYSNELYKPVKYNAVVIKRFADKRNVLQKCTDVLKYDPGQYYIEINTLPAYKTVIFIDFFAENYVFLKEPGTVQFTNSSPLGKVALQCVLGDAFATFHEINITGRISDQTLELLPGIYKAVIPIDPKMPLAGTKLVDFKVESGKNTQIELR